MGSCLEQIAPHNDEESSKRFRLAYYRILLSCVYIYCILTLFSSVGRILFMLGNVQSELQRLLDTYVSCLLQT